MKTERNSDDLWTQRTLSTFQTFARNQGPQSIGGHDGLGKGQGQGGQAQVQLQLQQLMSGNGNGHGHGHGHGHSPPYTPHPPGSGGPPKIVSNSGNNSPGNGSHSSGSGSCSTSDGSAAPIQDLNGSGSIGGGSRNGTLTRLNGINKAKPVAIPILLTVSSHSNSNQHQNQNQNQSPQLSSQLHQHHHHQQQQQQQQYQYNPKDISNHSRSTSLTVDNQNQLNLHPSPPPTVLHSHSHSLSFNSSDSVSNVELDYKVYIPTELDEQLLQVEVELDKGDRRFGFSVIGGRDEGFPPCIDEISTGSPADKADLEVGDEILEVNGRSLEDATHTEVISHIHQCIRSRTICLRVKRRSGNKLALDLASQSNVQDAFVIAVEQQARERLEKLSALKRIKPVDMTKLSHQLSETPSGSGDTSELNGLIEAATGSPIYVTSAAELSSSQVALHRGGGGEDEEDDVVENSSSSRVDHSPRQQQPSPRTSSPTCVVPNSSGNNIVLSPSNVNNINPLITSSKSPLLTNGHRNRASSLLSETLVKSVPLVPSGKLYIAGTTNVPNGQYSISNVGVSVDRDSVTRVGLSADEDELNISNLNSFPITKSSSKESLNSSKKGATSSENITGSQESIEGLQSTPSHKGLESRGSKSSSRESVVEATQYANMMNMVEWDNGPHREMAVDVPDSFVPRNKTPPRYPPSKATTLNSNNNKTPKSATSKGNGTATLPGYSGQNGAAGKPVPPPRIGEKDGWSVNNNNTQAPHVPPRTLASPNLSAEVSPSRDQAERIRKYQEELKKRREQEERQAREEEFLRTSLRGSKKLQALEARRDETPSPLSSTDPSGFVNDAYDEEEDRNSYSGYQKVVLQKPVGLSELVGSLQQVQLALKKNGLHLDDSVSAVGSLMQTPEFQQVLAVHNKVQDVWCFNTPPTPISAHARPLVQECLGSLFNCSVPESTELVDLLSRVDLEGVLYAHDKIAERERLLVSTETPLNLGESVDDVLPSKSSRPAFVPEQQPDDHIKVVRIEKTQDPLGATVRNEGEAVVIGRIVKGGAAERSGLLHEGDEILEVNGIEMRGKTVNEVCDILSRMTGTLTFLIVPTLNPQPPISQRRDVLVHVRAHFDYDPEDDIYVPCRELGIAFSKGDVIHVINQDDPNWWQAHREGEEDQALAGLIPSKSFQEQREAVKQTLLGETETREKSKKGTLLCAKTHKKKKKKIPYSTAFNDDFDAEEIPTYEEVSLYYPRASFKRPVVLIGPPNIGRHELRQRLMQESERFAAAVPHTSRTRKDGEVDGQDYHFISRAQFESDILGRRFVEHGEFEKAYYGTSLEAIRSVVNIGKICVLNLHPQSLKILRTSDLKPYIVFVAPPPLERLKQMRIARGEAYKEEELIDIIEKAREMEEKYGHYFDLVIINNDIERTYHELVQRINYIEREPQWVPAFWLKQ